MRVIIKPGTYSEENTQLTLVMRGVFHRHMDGPAAMARLTELLVEKGVLTLADCQALGAPHMEEAP